MAILCYVTDQIRKDASTHGIPRNKLDDFASDLEERQSLAGFDHFPPPCLTKKKIFGFNFRLIAAEKQLGDHVVVVLLRLVVRGGADYAEFLRDPPGWAQRFYNAEMDETQLRSWVDDRTEAAPPIPVPELSNVEKAFLWTPAYTNHRDEVVVCETEEWVRGISEGRVADRLILLPGLILAALDRPAGQVQLLRAPDDDRLAIIVFNAPARKQCVLLSVSYAGSNEELQLRMADWSDALKEADANTILRHSRRSYLSVICCDDDMWMSVQRNPQANLALSPEEAEILRSSRLEDPSFSAFPLFINGRAGSGKSTLLQYLFAECILRWSAQSGWESTETSHPLYFASSSELLKVAKDIVRSLLKANHEHLLGQQRPNDSLLAGLDD